MEGFILAAGPVPEVIDLELKQELDEKRTV